MPPAFFETVVGESLKLPARVWRAALAALMEPEGPRGDPARIEAPALILWGDRDGFATRADQDASMAVIPQARLLVYAGTGHAPHWEEPARAAADLAAFATEFAGKA